VLTRWINMAGLVAATGVIWAVFIPYAFPWIGFVWMSLAVSGALWLRLRTPSSIAKTISELDAEPVPVVPTRPPPFAP
jgi:hypothetical protein